MCNLGLPSGSDSALPLQQAQVWYLIQGTKIPNTMQGRPKKKRKKKSSVQFSGVLYIQRVMWPCHNLETFHYLERTPAPLITVTDPPTTLAPDSLIYSSLFKFYQFISGCAESSLRLCRLSLVAAAGLLSGWGAWISRVVASCGAQALGSRASVVPALKLWVLGSGSCGAQA